ncbi:MAG: MFS transporter [Acidimicrobiales bacterium]
MRRPLPPGFGVIWTTVALDLVGFGIILPVLARYAEDLGASPTEAGLLVASFSVAQLVCSPLSGRLSDRYGRKPVLLVSLAGTAVGSLLTGLAGSLWLLFAARLLDGASGASVSVAQAAVTDVAAPEDRPRLLGLLGAAFGVGFSMGPAIGGLAALVSHRLPFFIAAAIAAANALVAVRRLPETLHATGPVEPAAPFAEPALESGPADVSSASGPGLPRLVLVGFVTLVAFSGFEATFSLLADVRFGLSESATYGVFFLIGLALVAVQGGLVHPVHARIGELNTVRAGIFVNTLGLALLAFDLGWTALVLALGLLVVGQGLLAPTLASAVAGRAASERRGAALGFQQAVGGLARVVGPATAGILFEHVGVAAPYAVGSALVLAAGILISTPG